MSIKELKHYKELCDKGNGTLKERLQIIQEQKQKNLSQIAELQKANAMLEYKEDFYTNLIINGSENYQS